MAGRGDIYNIIVPQFSLKPGSDILVHYFVIYSFYHLGTALHEVGFGAFMLFRYIREVLK